MIEIHGLSESDVVEIYFKYEPRVKTWALAHVESGTCKAAIADLRELQREVREGRAANRKLIGIEEVTRPKADKPEPGELSLNDCTAPFRMTSVFSPNASEHTAAAANAAQTPTELRRASDDDIIAVLRDVYREACPSPNLTEVYPLARGKLKERGLRATKQRIQDLAGQNEFKLQRNKAGQRRSNR